MAFGNYCNYPYQQPAQSLIWVQGIEAAKAYPVAPGNTVQLWDSETAAVYLKSADQNGIPTMRAFDLVERVTERPQTEYVTRKEFEELKKLLAEREADGE